MSPVQIWPNIAIVINVVFQEILALTRLQHILSSNRIIVQKTDVVISMIQKQMICDIVVLFQKWNSHDNFIYTSHVTANNPFLSY